MKLTQLDPLQKATVNESTEELALTDSETLDEVSQCKDFRLTPYLKVEA
jgi:hypothetical protein